MTAAQIQSAQFTMPRPEIGSPVRWYRHGCKDGTHTEIAFVLRASARNIHVRTAAGIVREAVRHIDDPKLNLSADQREPGAWDFTEDFYRQRQEREELFQRVSRLEKTVAGLTANKVREQASGDGGLSEYQALRQQALSAGIEFTGNPKKEWLVGELAALENVE